ncbi:MAG: glutamate ligase domain-containing protein [Bacilli bacterium]
MILVCGAAGNKDKTKRPLMGNVATEYADYTIFTSEDPRLEDPNDIIKEMTKMIDLESPNYKIIINRQDALSYAFKIAKKDDIILVTGKGRENFLKKIILFIHILILTIYWILKFKNKEISHFLIFKYQ